MKKVLFIASFMLIAIFACTSVYAADMTASELLATVSNKTITLTEDVTLTNALAVPADVEEIDLGGKTLNLKAGVTVTSSLVIKNGTITRDATFTAENMLTVGGATTEFTLSGVTVDGKNVAVKHAQSGCAIRVTAGEAVTLDDSNIVNHNFDYSGLGGIVRIDNVESVDVINTTVSNNISKYIGIFGVKNCGYFTFYADSVVSNNTAAEASGIHVEDTDATIAGTIEGNKTTATDGNGAGLYVLLNDKLNSSNELKTVIITEPAKIINNVAKAAGGGVYVTGPKDVNVVTGQVLMLGGTITGNKAEGTPAADTLKDGGGAGVYVARGNMTIEGGTIENNTSTSGIGDAILVSNQGGNTKAGKVEITAGYIDGTVKVSETYADVAVKGGTFTDDVNAYVAAGADKAVVDGVTYVGVANKITVKAGANGKATVTEKAVEGQPVKVTVTPDKNYELASIKVTDKDGEPVEVKNNTFTMPDLDVTVEVTFKEMKKDGTPATGSMNVVMIVSAVLSVVTLGVLVSKKYAKNN